MITDLIEELPENELKNLGKDPFFKKITLTFNIVYVILIFLAEVFTKPNCLCFQAFNIWKNPTRNNVHVAITHSGNNT